MAKYMNHSSQGLLLLAMVLLACSTVPARISAGRSIDGAMNRSDDDGAGTVLDSYNGCSYNKNPYHEIDAIFCCDKDHKCWPSLQECMPNCPCKKGIC